MERPANRFPPSVWAFVLLVFGTDPNPLPAGEDPFLFVDYSAEVSVTDLGAYDVLILSPDAFDRLPEKADSSQKRLGYLSVCEIAPDASYREEAFASGVESEGRNETWGSDLIDPGSPAWRKFVIGSLAPAIREKGFDGFFLDTAESVELLAEEQPERAVSFREGLVDLVEELREGFPEAELVINRGFPVLPELHGTVDGVLAESLFQTYDYGEQTFGAASAGDVEWLLGHLRRAREAGLAVYVIDFLPMTESVLAGETVRRIREEGFVPLISEPDLMGGIVAPLPVVPRQVLCLYGEIVPEGEFEWAEDTDSMSHFQLALEYLGFELEYRNYQREGLPVSSDPDQAGLLIDSSLTIPAANQKEFVDWLARCKERGMKIVFVGSLPFLVPEQRERFRSLFDLEGSLAGIGGVAEARLVASDPVVMGFETPVVARKEGGVDVRPRDPATVLLEVELTPRSGESLRIQPVFVTEWGGATLYPYLASLNPEQNSMLQVDPFAFLARVFDSPEFPVPDTTTLQGRRIYFSHIDGDGFFNFSELSPGTRSGIVIRDRIIDHFGLPVTVSFIESEINGDSTVYEEREGESFVEEAREVFANPFVEPASHTYSHPFFWSYADPTSASYETQNVNIKTEYNYDRISYPREIVDSVDYMNEVLGVEGKTADLLLWSGNCRPPPEALKVAADAGILNMNGGNTVITDRAPFLSLVSPKAVRWGGQTQVYAPIQNENNFNNSFGNNRFGGYANAIETFRRTESPRRLKPLNVYYHFYSADRFDSFTALRKVIEFCVEQEIHPLWASEFARIVLDSIGTGVYRMGPRAWRVVNQGISQTLRLPVEAGFPDWDRSTGIIGFSDFQGQRYFHTDGRKRVDLHLVDTLPARPFLRSSGASVERFAADADRLSFTSLNRSRASLPVALEGMGENAEWSVESGGESRRVRSTRSGDLVIEAPTGRMDWRVERIRP